MPPSGYSKKQSVAIVDFLQSISISLKEEGTEFQLTPQEALLQEISNIDEIVASNIFPPISNCTLLLTRLFYEKILDNKPNTYQEYSDIVKNVLPEIEKEILDIHVPNIKAT